MKLNCKKKNYLPFYIYCWASPTHTIEINRIGKVINVGGGGVRQEIGVVRIAYSRRVYAEA